MSLIFCFLFILCHSSASICSDRRHSCFWLLALHLISFCRCIVQITLRNTNLFAEETYFCQEKKNMDEQSKIEFAEVRPDLFYKSCVCVRACEILLLF